MLDKDLAPTRISAKYIGGDKESFIKVICDAKRRGHTSVWFRKAPFFGKWDLDSFQGACFIQDNLEGLRELGYKIDDSEANSVFKAYFVSWGDRKNTY